MSLPIFQRTIVDSSGNIQPGASVAVRNETTGDLVPIFADREGGTAKANPFLADSEGFATFYVETGEYQVTATTPAGTITWSHVAIGDTALLQLAQPTGSSLVGLQQAGGVARTAESKLRESVSVKDFGAVGDGVADDTTAVGVFRVASGGESGRLNAGEYAVTSAQLPANGVISGDGREITTIKRTATGNIVNAVGLNGAKIEGVTLDMNRSAVGGDGQGLAMTGENVHVKDVTVKGFARLASGGGTGIVVYSTDLLNKSNRFVIENVDLIGHTDPLASETFGWILADVDYSSVSHAYAENIIGNVTSYGHELKNTSSWNNLHSLTTKYGIYGYGHGQQDVGLPGPVGNVGWGMVNAQCDRGVLLGDGNYNLIGGTVSDWNDSPAKIGKRGVYAFNESNGVFPLNLVHGDGVGFALEARDDSRRNYFSIAAYAPDATTLVNFNGAGTAGNFVNVLHTGENETILTRIADSTGNGYRGLDANVVHSPSTGERVGSRSGFFRDVLGFSGASFLSGHYWRKESADFAIQAFATPGNTGDQAGISYAIPGFAGYAHMIFTKAASAAGDYWQLKVGNVNILRFFTTVMRPETDNAIALGSASWRFTDVFGVRFRAGNGEAIWTSGAGTPEGAVTAAIGSLYTRTDGGAGSTLYVKETGTGNTGWVAK